MQIVYNTEIQCECSKCGNNLAGLGNFTYTGFSIDTANKKEEFCKCKKCGKIFILRYEYFNEKGHIKPFIFNGDVNDSTYSWQDQLTTDQRIAITSHIKTCVICTNRMTEEILSDTWFASIIHSTGRKRKSKS
jgi:hypothetical protein